MEVAEVSEWPLQGNPDTYYFWCTTSDGETSQVNWRTRQRTSRRLPLHSTPGDCQSVVNGDLLHWLGDSA